MYNSFFMYKDALEKIKFNRMKVVLDILNPNVKKCFGMDAGNKWAM